MKRYYYVLISSEDSMAAAEELVLDFAQPDDIGPMLGIYAAAAVAAYAGVVGTTEQLQAYAEDPQLKAKFTANWISIIAGKRPGSAILAAHYAGAVRGYASYGPCDEPEQHAPACLHLNSNYVHPDFQGGKRLGLPEGIGTRMVKAVLTQATVRRADVRLFTTQGTAESFYQRFGFTETGNQIGPEDTPEVARRHGLRMTQVEMLLSAAEVVRTS